MRIAFISSEFITEVNFDGGLSNFINRVTLALLEMGHEAIVVVSSDRNETLWNNGICVHRVHINMRRPQPTDHPILRKFTGSEFILKQSYLLNQKVREIHSRQPFDIIQYPNLEALGLFCPNRAKIVVRISSYTPWINRAYGQSAGWISNFWEELAMMRANGIYCPSELIAHIIQDRIRRPVKVLESPFFMDIQSLNLSTYQSALAGKQYLLFFGTIGVLKGADTIANILFPLLERHHQLYFAFAGKELDYKHQGMSMMEYIFTQAGVHKDRVIYLGKLRHEALYPVIQHAQAVVLPSRIDNFPNTCLEAMAFERVVIGTYGTSFEQLIHNGMDGFLCQPDSPQDLLMCIEKVLSLSSADLQCIGKSASKRIEQLKPEYTVQRLVEYYQEMMSHKEGNPQA